MPREFKQVLPAFLLIGSRIRNPDDNSRRFEPIQWTPISDKTSRFQLLAHQGHTPTTSSILNDMYVKPVLPSRTSTLVAVHIGPAILGHAVPLRNLQACMGPPLKTDFVAVFKSVFPSCTASPLQARTIDHPDAIGQHTLFEQRPRKMVRQQLLAATPGNTIRILRDGLGEV